jgi:hypothetical protein
MHGDRHRLDERSDVIAQLQIVRSKCNPGRNAHVLREAAVAMESDRRLLRADAGATGAQHWGQTPHHSAAPVTTRS